MSEIATNLDGDTYDAFVEAARQLAEEREMDQETLMKSMRKLIYMFVTRI